MNNKNASVTLIEILESKEERAMYQREIISRYHCPLVSFTVVMPGNVKQNEKSGIIFKKGIEQIEKALLNYKILFRDERYKKTGEEAFFSVDIDGKALKRLMTEVEDSSKIGRLFDIDVIDTDNIPVSRSSIGLHERKCLVCSNDAHICARSKTHTVDDILHEIERILADE